MVGQWPMARVLLGAVTVAVWGRVAGGIKLGRIGMIRLAVLGLSRRQTVRWLVGLPGAGVLHQGRVQRTIRWGDVSIGMRLLGLPRPVRV